MLPHSLSRASVAVLGVTLVAITGCTATSRAATGRTPTPADVEAAGEACVVAAAGDVVGEANYKTSAARTAELISSARPKRVLALGDLVYPDGTAADYASYYDPTW